jgi:hypothetical protein
LKGKINIQQKTIHPQEGIMLPKEAEIIAEENTQIVLVNYPINSNS